MSGLRGGIVPLPRRAPVRLAMWCFGSVINFVLLVVFGIAVSLAVAWYGFQIAPLAVTSGSMEPTLPVDSLVLVRHVSPTLIHVGDIISFDPPGPRVGRITHRVAKIEHRNGQMYFITKGDANKQRDDWSKFLGPNSKPPPGQHWLPGITYGSQQATRYVWVVPWLGKLDRLTGRPHLRVGIVLGVLLLVGLQQLVRVWRATAPAAAVSRPQRSEAAMLALGDAIVDDPPSAGRVTLQSAPQGHAVVFEGDGGARQVCWIDAAALPDLATAVPADLAVRTMNLCRDRLSAGAQPVQASALHATLNPSTVALLDDRLPRAGIDAAMRTAITAAQEHPGDELMMSAVVDLALVTSLLDHLSAHDLHAVAATSSMRRPLRRDLGRAALRVPGAAVVLIALLATVTPTGAMLIDSVAMGQVSVSGDQIVPPTSFTFVSSSGTSPTNLDMTWATPTNIPPSSYDVWRSTSPGVSTAGAPTANTTSASWTQPLNQCNTYYYKVRSKFASMYSVDSAEQSWYHDGTAPTVANATIYATPVGPDPANPLAPTPNWVGSATGRPFAVYANITDNCVGASSLIVRANVSSLAAAQTALTMTFCSPACQPVAGGPTFNYKATGLTVDTTPADGSQPAWSITAIDRVATATSQANSSGAVAGGTVTVDGSNPTSLATPRATDETTRYYDPNTLGYGEIRPSQTFRVFAQFSDAGSGLHGDARGVSADMSKVGAPSVVPLAADTTTQTRNAVTTWNRSGTGVAGAVGVTPPAGSCTDYLGANDKTYCFGVVAYDKVGNTGSVGSTSTGSVSKVEVDNSALTLSSCNGSSSGAANGLLDGTAGGPYDQNTLNFNDTVPPFQLATNWGVTTAPATLTGTATLRDGSGLPVVTTDYITWDYLTIFRGATNQLAFDLQDGTWLLALVGTRAYQSDFQRTNRSSYLLRYWGATTAKPGLSSNTGTMHLAALTDAAGNGLSSADVASCTLNTW